MPKIGKRHITIKNRMVWFDVMYSQKDGFYLKDFPAEILKFARDGYKPKLDSEHDMVIWYQVTTEIYHKTLKHIRKVIAIKLQLSILYTHAKTSDNSYTLRKDVSSKFAAKTCFDGSGSFKHQMRFDYKILYVEERDEVVDSYFICNPDDTIGHRTSESDVSFLLDYTEEREVFCQNIEANLVVLADKFIKFFSLPIDDLTKAIDASGKLFLTA